ncbi:MAG: hypothetical protein H0U74_22980 [Bradymonadaceae bacterium]|nr:hypothetical protein [Lujinxingiaceae bacterium]
MLYVKPRYLSLFVLVLIGVFLLPPALADAQQRPRPTQQKKKRPPGPVVRGPQPVTVPVDIGVGPTFNMLGNIDVENLGLSGPIYEDQTFHYGIRISLAAIIDQEFMRNNQRLIPRQYRDQAKSMGEIRIKPGVAALIPTSLIISPKFRNTGVYAATWTPLGLGLALLSEPVRLSLHGGVIATYAFIHSDTIPSPTHFLRPGAELSLDLEIPITRQFLISFGWASQFYIPQKIGGSILETGLEDGPSLWHIGQGFLLLHFRFPYTTYL